MTYQDVYITQGKVSCRHLVAADILLLLSISNIKPEHRSLERRVHKNGTISKYSIYNKPFDTCCSALATSHCIVSSQLDAPPPPPSDPERATSFSPERQPMLLLFNSPQHRKTISTFGHCLLDSINYPARKWYMGDAAPSDFKKRDTAPGLQLKRSTSLHYINVRYSDKGLNIKAIRKTLFFFFFKYSCMVHYMCHTIIGPVQFLTVLEQSWDETWNCNV